MERDTREKSIAIMQEYPDVLNAKQVGEVLQVNVRTVYRLIQEEKMQCIRIGRQYRVPKIMLLTFLSIAQPFIAVLENF